MTMGSKTFVCYRKAGLRFWGILSLSFMLAFLGTARSTADPIHKYKPFTGSIAGTITNKSGMGLPLAQLELLQNDHIIQTIQTDSEGFYAFKNLADGAYAIRVSAAAYKPALSSPIVVDPEHEPSICNLSVVSLHPIRYRLSYKNDVNCADTPLTRQVDSMVVLKSKRELLVFHANILLKVYHVSLGVPVGAKHFKYDHKTPEGIYHIDGKSAYSAFHKNLGISYPSEADRAYARRYGKATGTDIKIHGTANGDDSPDEEYQNSDWTWGCVGVVNREIDELFLHVPVGTVINLLP